MTTQSSFHFTGYPLCITGGTQANAQNISKQHAESIILHCEVDSGSTATFNVYCYSDISGTPTQYLKTSI